MRRGKLPDGGHDVPIRRYGDVHWDVLGGGGVVGGGNVQKSKILSERISEFWMNPNTACHFWMYRVFLFTLVLT